MFDPVMLGSAAVLVLFVFVLFVASRWCAMSATTASPWSKAVEPRRLDHRWPDRAGGEAGFQPDVLRGGFHFFFPFQYRIHSQSLVTIPQGQIGYVFAVTARRWAHADAGQQCRDRRFPGCARVPGRRAKGAPAHDPARGHLCHQHRAIRDHHARTHPRPDAQYNDGDLFDQMQTLIAGRGGFRGGGDQGCLRPDRHRDGA
jgi:hypothetical protein